MKRFAPIALALTLAAGIAGCADTGVTEDELLQAKRDAYVQGREEGYAAGVKEGRRQSAEQRAKQVAAARDTAFEDGVDYVLHDLQVVPGQDYAIAFKQGRRGFFVKDSLPMKPGKTYECPPQSPYCTVGDSDTAVPSATSEPAPQDPCHPSYPNVCLEPSAADYDCAGSGDDGPEFVEGPVRILGGDPYDLDGSPRDGFGCDSR
jgi:hypothetical protein